MKQLVIEVRGGVVQEVYTNEEIQVVLIDWDIRQCSADICAHSFRPSPLHAMPEDTAAEIRNVI